MQCAVATQFEPVTMLDSFEEVKLALTHSAPRRQVEPIAIFCVMQANCAYSYPHRKEAELYIPKTFEMSDRDVLCDFIEQHSFGIVISRQASEFIASHLPMLVDREAGTDGRLLGHFALANSQWKLIDDEAVLAIFNGPHAYISPAWDETKNSVPTWNYLVVHVYGRLRIVKDRDLVRATLLKTVDKYEAGSSSPWSMDVPDSSFIDSLLEAIVGFEIDITRIEGKWKLSQNHSAQRRQRYIDSLRQQGGDMNTAIAARMLQD